MVLRAINDVNLPKFVDADLPLFQGITSDLFLGLKVPTPDYEILLDGMKAACGQLMAKCKDTHTFTNIQPTSILMTKCIQFYETVTVRHSLMIVGAAMSMKTAYATTLITALAFSIRTRPTVTKTELEMPVTRVLWFMVVI